MFQKPAFGTTTTNFGSFNSGTSTASPFGGFKPATGTSAFGAPPAFGATTSTQPATGGGLFGSTNTTGGLFGSSTASTSTSGFGASTSSFGFGAAQPTTGGLFGNTSTVGGGGGLFGNTHNQTAFGAKPTGFGFGSTTTTGAATGSLFGSTPSTGTGLFGQQTNTLGGGGLFSNNTAGAFGQQQQQQTGTAHVKYNPVVGTDVVVKSGTSQSVNIKHHCITCMKEYENKSLEELRLEDYVAGRKGNTSGVFGGFQQQTENKPLFGNTSFGQPATTSAPSVFGGGGLGGAGGFAAQPSSFSFANNAQTTNTTGLFGANKPAFGAAPTTGGTGLFGATTTQAPTFGTNTSTFGFGATTQNQQQTGGLLFGGAKPATTGFGAAPATTGFGAFGSTGVFGAKTQAPTFGTQAPAFGSMTTGAFGTTTSSAGGLFGGHQGFGKPTTAPTFGFNTQQTGLGTGLGGGLGSNTFQAKPAAPAFGQLGTTMFPQPAQNNTFKTGLEGGLGGGMFGNNTSLGGGLGLGMGSMLNNQTQGMNNSLSGSSAGGNVHEQILTLAARPYGDSPLFKDLLPDSSTTAEDVLKPTNPAAVKAVLDSSGAYRVSSPTALRLTVTPRTSTRRDDKKSLFDGLEESDASLEDKLCLKPSRKRLVLRPNQKANDSHQDSVDHANDTARSLEERPQSNGGPPTREMPSEQSNVDEVDRRQEEFISLKNAGSTGWQGDVSTGSDRHASWLNSSKMPWNDKEKPIDGEPTPRLYPNLDKDIQTQVSERRASWLTTKPLRPALVKNPDSAENSVRELAVRTDRSHDKENIDTLSMSEEENVAPRELPPHPTGVKLTRPGYYTIPSLDEMIAYMRPDGSCVVPHLTIGRKNYGNVYYDCEIDVAGMDLDSLVHFLNKEVIVYPEESVKPPLGEGLNRRAYVTLDRVWPRDKSEKRAITEPERLLKMEYESKLRRVCDKHNTKFIEYRPQTGSWVFRVEHFSKYGLTDSDEEEDPQRQVVVNALQTSAPPASKLPVPPPTVGLGGLGGPAAPLVAEDNLFAMQQTSLNLLNGAAKAFEMDTTEDNNTESQSLYLDNKAYGVKSPTSELARLEHRQSHNVQLMKASLYADTEMEDDASISTGDQLVPVSVPLLSVPSLPPTVRREDLQISEIEVSQTEETPMKPLIVRPHTIVLKYHRKVPPFKQTIAGRLDASYISDMSVCRARHSRVGFAPGGALAFTTSYDSVNELPRSAELSDLGQYVRGRSSNDWSEPVLVRMALGQPEKDDGMLEVLKKHLATLLEHSTYSEESEWQCARLALSASPRERRAVLSQYLKDAATAHTRYKFGVSGAYCYEVWRLCDALWGADLENDGVPGTDPLSIVNRHKKFLDWLKTAVAEATDEDLSKPTHGEEEDEADGHSARIWTLLLGGRILEACKVAREHGDLNMAILIAQAAGDPTFRSLITRQLSLWRECGADTLISSHRWATLQLIAGQSSPRDKLRETDWLRALHATARYLCPHVPSLEQVMRTYEGFFTEEQQDGDGDVDLSLIENDEMSMKLPLPPYVTHYDVTVVNNGKQRRVLDLRYELIRARAFNCRPKLRPAAYTPDPMDYSLCFLLGTWFGNPTIESITGTADQLEASGNWHLAVQALSYHPDDIARGHLIRGVLSRHAPAKADTPELKARLELIRRLKVPEKWLLLAQAHRAKYERLPAVEAEHLVGAGQWNAAHKVLLEELLPEAVLADDLQSIAPLLEKMNEAAERHEVSGWENGGQALHHYLHVCDEIRGLVSSAEAQRDRASVHARLEALRPKVTAACRALGGLQPKSVGVRFARAEMGARLVQCTLAAGEPPAHLAGLLRALKLPPDTTHTASLQISSLLAARAAESCGAIAANTAPARAVPS
ncbi:hypothetical protein PYW08_012166 [Mythimna loreyi]|uniref:Uncharacterized protein n=1 Tax=Mythimna loreyi TaxID=667449 RepID=A0ACC2PZN4_9NEOP|nr:hypothetical protein PYW08_012166 [Mythimna loreyi]